MPRKRKAARPFRHPDGLTREEQTEQVIEAALSALDLNFPPDQAIAERWAREAALPPLEDPRGLEILHDPLGTLNLGSDEKAQFRRWLRAQSGGVRLHEDWILARMRARERETQ